MNRPTRDSGSRDHVAPVGDRPRSGPSSASYPSLPPSPPPPPGLARATLAAAAPGHSPLGCSPAWGGGRRGVLPRRRRSGVAAGLPGAAWEIGWTEASPLAVGWHGQAAPARPRSGPFGPHLGLGGPTAGRLGGVASRRQGSGDGRWGADGAGAALLHRGRWGLAGPGVAWYGLLLRPDSDRDGAGGTGLLHNGGGGGSLPRGYGAAAPVDQRLLSSFSCPRGGDLSEAAWVALRPRWRMLVDGKLAGMYRHNHES
nr:myosin heavy chain IB-like [Aegilops tauschii subsp. strangulata]